MIILVNPIGNFPLNDDWSYGKAVQSVVEHGEFKLFGWTATNLISQVYWGALFCLPFGYSFTALRFSTLTLGLMGVLSTYGLLRLVDAPPKYAFIGAVIVAINPIYFQLSNTFMNDVPFYAFATLSLLFLFKGIKYESTFYIILGVLLTLITILSRQIGLVIPIAFGLAYITKKGINTRTILLCLSTLLFGFGVNFCYHKWLRLTMRMPESFGNQINTMFEQIHQGLGNTIYIYSSITLYSLVYLGLFLFPLLIIAYPMKLRELSTRQRILSLLVTVPIFTLIMKILTSRQLIMPLMGNILYDLGLGPIIMKNSDLPGAPDFFWLSVTAIGVLGAAILIQYLLIASYHIFQGQELYNDNNKRWINIFVMSTIFIYFFPLGFLGFDTFGFYDRYLIFLLPLLMMAILVSNSNNSNRFISYKSFLIAIILILLLGSFTIGATHDYLSLNRTRWQALNYLMQKGIPPDRIDGGFEFNGWFLYDPEYKFDSDTNKSWYWVDNDDYVITLNPVPGYEVIKSYPYSNWLPLQNRNIIVLHKIRNHTL